ncbi:helix-turn-helix domain-containing protein [Streptomyces niveus]|uniref:Crp/Fnr family transcriptional regulator n=1 Tax=Streptomyces niveus TaxID=193462 RepID=UPI00342BF72A
MTTEADPIDGPPRRTATIRDAMQRLVELHFAPYSLSPAGLEMITQYGVPRRHHKGMMLRRGAPGGQMDVHFIVWGCAAERTFDTPVLRFWGQGALLGDLDIVVGFRRESIGVRTIDFLSDTMTISCPIQRVRRIAEADTTVMAMIASIIAERHLTSEKIYNNSRRPPTERVAGLLWHLVKSTITLPRPEEFVLRGPTQAELGEALMLSRATVEKALAIMRKEGILANANAGLRSGHRGYIVKNAQRLEALAWGYDDDFAY